ncbi:hypothetical protein TomMM35A_33310 [Sphingobium sp. TomMM35A]
MTLAEVASDAKPGEGDIAPIPALPLSPALSPKGEREHVLKTLRSLKMGRR